MGFFVGFFAGFFAGFFVGFLWVLKSLKNNEYWRVFQTYNNKMEHRKASNRSLLQHTEGAGDRYHVLKLSED